MIEAAQIRDVLSGVVPTADWANVDEDDSLEAAGLDSLDKASFFLELEHLMGRKIPDEDYDKMDSIKSIKAYFNASD
jgi:acyl carrier protein